MSWRKFGSMGRILEIVLICLFREEKQMEEVFCLQNEGFFLIE